MTTRDRTVAGGGGRPRRELTPSRRVDLIERAETAAVTAARADQAREALRASMKEAREEGASVRVIAEAVGLSNSGAYALLGPPSANPNEREGTK